MTIPPITRPTVAPATQSRKADAPRPVFDAMRIAASGLTAQRVRMDVIAQNLANVETTHTAEGGPYQRRVVQMEADVAASGTSESAGTDTSADETSAADNVRGVRVIGIAEDTTEGPLVYNPGHPDADKNGYVRMPNVNMTDELMDLMNARRIYEANATVFQVAKAMLHRAIDI